VGKGLNQQLTVYFKREAAGRCPCLKLRLAARSIIYL
jgi:hypothetical protein